MIPPKRAASYHGRVKLGVKYDLRNEHAEAPRKKIPARKPLGHASRPLLGKFTEPMARSTAKKPVKFTGGKPN